MEQESLPSRERGLKFDDRPRRYTTSQVAPFTGAWIEMARRTPSRRLCAVAPFTGAWIEILT